MTYSSTPKMESSVNNYQATQRHFQTILLFRGEYREDSKSYKVVN
jgi:hypothetical protein